MGLGQHLLEFRNCPAQLPQLPVCLPPFEASECVTLWVDTNRSRSGALFDLRSANIRWKPSK